MDKITAKAIELTKEASDRGRWVLLVLQITCIVVFMAAWHEVPQGWTYARLRAAQAAVWYLDCSSAEHPELTHLPSQEIEKSRHDECHYLAGEALSEPIAIGSRPNCIRTPQEPFCPDEIKHAKDFVAARLLTPSEARKHLEALHNSFVERTMNVAVPFLGITLDVNDLGLLGGITFSLLLLWFLFSLRREAENLEILFSKATDDGLRDVYQLLEMTQVLTIPVRRKAKQNLMAAAVRFILGPLEYLLFVTPLMVQSFVVWNDRATLQLGRVLNDQLALSELHWEESLLAIMAALTLFCFLKAVQANQHWNKAYKRISAPAGKDAGSKVRVEVHLGEREPTDATKRFALREEDPEE